MIDWAYVVPCVLYGLLVLSLAGIGFILTNSHHDPVKGERVWNWDKRK